MMEIPWLVIRIEEKIFSIHILIVFKQHIWGGTHRQKDLFSEKKEYIKMDNS